MPRPGPRRPLVAIRLSQTGIDHIDQRAKDANVNRSEMIRRMLTYANEYMPKEDAMTTSQTPQLPAKGDRVIDKTSPECGPGTVAGIRPYERYVAWDDTSRSWVNAYNLEYATMPAALRAAGIDADNITETPDRLVTVLRADGDWFILGEDGAEPDRDGHLWWTGIRYAVDGGTVDSTDSWTSLDAMAAAVAAWWHNR